MIIPQKGKHFYGYSRTIKVPVGVVAKGDDTEVAVFSAPFRCKIVQVGIIANTAITGANTDYYTLSFQNKISDGSGTSEIASKAYTNGVNASAFDEENFGAVSYNLLNEGDVVSFLKTESGAGMATPALMAVIRYVKA